jgi:hypothetical protein
MDVNKEFALLTGIKDVQPQCRLISDALRLCLGPHLIPYGIPSFDKDIPIDAASAVAAAEDFIKTNPERGEVASLKRLIKPTKQILFDVIRGHTIPDNDEDRKAYCACFYALQKGKSAVLREDRLTGCRLKFWSSEQDHTVLKFENSKDPSCILTRTVQSLDFGMLPKLGILFAEPNLSHEYLYGCTYGCGQTFESKREWEFHYFKHQMSTQEKWRCDEPDEKRISCAQVFKSKDEATEHMKNHGISDNKETQDRLEGQKIGRRGHDQGWCGWCKKMVKLPPERTPMEMMKHISKHLDEGDLVATWIPPDGHLPNILNAEQRAFDTADLGFPSSFKISSPTSEFNVDPKFESIYKVSQHPRSYVIYLKISLQPSSLLDVLQMRLEANRLLEKMVFKSDEDVDRAIRLASDLCRILKECVTKVSTYQTPPELDDSVMMEIQCAIWQDFGMAKGIQSIITRDRGSDSFCNDLDLVNAQTRRLLDRSSFHTSRLKGRLERKTPVTENVDL